MVIQRLKDLGPGIVNPAAMCNPPVLSGDAIVGVNGVEVKTFVDIVKAIRGATGRVELWIER